MGSVGASFHVSPPDAGTCLLKKSMRTLNSKSRSDRGLYVEKELDDASRKRQTFRKTEKTGR